MALQNDNAAAKNLMQLEGLSVSRRGVLRSYALSADKPHKRALQPVLGVSLRRTLVELKWVHGEKMGTWNR